MQKLDAWAQLSIIAVVLMVGAGFLSAVNGVPNGFQGYLAHLTFVMFYGAVIIAVCALIARFADN